MPERRLLLQGQEQIQGMAKCLRQRCISSVPQKRRKELGKPIVTI